jgi:Tol biopolymer transport system component
MQLARIVGLSAALLVPLAGAMGACVGDDPALAAVAPGADADGGSDAAAAADAPASPDADADAATKPRCDVTKPFAAPRKVVGIRSAGVTDLDTAPFLTHDGQALYFSSDRQGMGDILVATRIGVDSFGDVKPVPAAANIVDTASQFEGSPFLAPDGLSLFFSRDLSVTTTALFVATRASLTTAFDKSAPVANLGTAQAQDNPFVTASGEWLYFTGSTDGSAFNIYRAKRGGDGAFANPALVQELSFGPKNSRPSLTDDELTIYFTSNQSGAFRIHTARRADKTAAFANITLVSELAIGDSSFTGHVSGDGCTIVFSAGTGTANALEIQIADKPPLP